MSLAEQHMGAIHRRRVRSASTIVATLVAVGVIAAPNASVSAQEVIDRILAVVAGRVITLSDVRGFLALRLVEVGPDGDLMGQTLNELIDRELILAEVERYPPVEPSLSDIEQRAVDVRSLFKDEASFTAALDVSGMTRGRLQDILREEIRTERYLEQRFGAAAQPTDTEVSRYYQEQQERFTRNGEPVPYADVRDDIRAELQDEQRRTLIESWVDGLRRRADVQVLYFPPG